MNIPLTPIRFLRYARQQFPNKTAIVCGERRFTYAEFAERASRLAGAIVAAGIEPGDRVAFLSGNCHRLLEAYYGVLEARAVLLPLNIRLASQEMAFILNDSGAKLLFLEKQFLQMVECFRGTVSTVEKFILLDSEAGAGWLSPQNYEQLLAASVPHHAEVMDFDENSLAELFYTSGTSANPKGVMLTHRNVYLHALNVAINFSSSKDTVELHTIPLFHANGWGVAHSLTFVGATHVMIPRFDPVEVFRLIQAERVQACSLVPTMANALVNCPERPKYDLSSLERITIGGAASSPTLIKQVEEKLGCSCFSGYGLTETCPVLTTAQPKPGGGWADQDRHANQAMTGYPIPGVEIRVVDGEGKDVPRDGQSIGEVIARSDGVMQGYWRQPEATADVMRGGWFHTGDMAVMNEEGYILIVDRAKDIIVSGGENISSLEIEKTLAAHPAVYEAAVIPVPDPRWGEAPKALVVLKPEMEAGEPELLDFCRSRMAHYKCPRSVEFLAALPKTGTGKILKKELRKKYWADQKSIRPEAVEKH